MLIDRVKESSYKSSEADQSRSDSVWLRSAAALNDVLRNNTSETALCFLPLPSIPKSSANLHECASYINKLRNLTVDIVPCMFVKTNPQVLHITTEL